MSVVTALEATLAEKRDRMSLLERVELRRAIDHAAGITYPPLTPARADKLAQLMAPRFRCTDVVPLGVATGASAGQDTPTNQ